MVFMEECFLSRVKINLKITNLSNGKTPYENLKFFSEAHFSHQNVLSETCPHYFLKFIQKIHFRIHLILIYTKSICKRVTPLFWQQKKNPKI